MLDRRIDYLIHILTSTVPDDKTTKDAVDEVINHFAEMGSACKTKKTG